MNIEQAFVNTNNLELIKNIVERRLNGDLQSLRIEYSVEAGDSYDAFLANEIKRKVAISPEKNGWVTILESKEVNDYSMLIEISKETESCVLAIIQYDSVGAWGYVLIDNGLITENYFSEEDDDYENKIVEIMMKKRIDNNLLLFREIFQSKNEKWIIVDKKSITS